MLPKREEAERLLKDAESCNPGPWGNHSRIAAYCAEKIAARCPGMDSQKAYILGLLHDIGRKFGTRHLGHVFDGYFYMQSLGYGEVAKVCLTHSFHSNTVKGYIGKFDTTEQELNIIETALHSTEFDDYDRLIQLCDALAGAEYIMNIEERMKDVKTRYGSYPADKWNYNMSLKTYFEEKTGEDIYNLLGTDNFNK